MRAKLVRLFVLWGAVAALSFVPSLPSWAQRGIQIVTPYPAVVTQAGKTVTLNLEVITATRQRVDLAITQTPPGWQTTLRGGGFVIRGVFGSPKTEKETPPQVQLEIRVPADAQPNTYRVSVKASGPGGTDVLLVDVTVSEIAAGAVTLTPEFPSQQGSATDSFNFSVTLNNNTPEKTTFNLSAEGPQGWTISARPSTESRATTVAVDGGATATVTVSADPPDEIVAGTYPIKVRAAGGGNNAEADLSVEITGNFQIELSTDNERLSADATAGDRTDLILVVRNTGTGALSEVKMTSTPPTGWKVNFDPETVDKIDAKQEARVTARITPAADSVAGDYQVNMTAAAGATTDNVDVRVTVKTSLLTGLLGVLLLAAVIFAVLWVFRRYGRR
jgi:uncharacterized membrane protein